MSKRTPKKTPAAHLKEGARAKILEMLDGWCGPLSWELMIDAVEKITGHRYSRQTLWNHERIRLAWIRRKAIHDNEVKQKPSGSAGLIAAQEQIAKLKNKVGRLENELNAFRAMFARWLHNSAIHGLTPEVMNEPLPPIDREVTKLDARSKRRSRGRKNA